MERLLQDVRFSVRSLLRSRGFTAVALLTLALGIGANTAMFSVVYGVLLRPLPYADADRLMGVYQANPRESRSTAGASLPDFEDWRQRSRAFDTMAAFTSTSAIIREPGEPFETEATFVTDDFFRTLGDSAQIGSLVSADDVRQARPVAVISDRLWRERFSADHSALGKRLNVQSAVVTIIGVMPPDFRFPTRATDVWAPQSILNEPLSINRQRNARMWEVVARLKSGTTREQAQSELNIIAAQLAAEYAATNEGWNATTVIPVRNIIVGDVDTALLIVFGVVGFTLLIACVNLANLLLARGAARSGEMAVRAALGASRARLIRQILTESVVLALAGGALGALLAAATTRSLLSLSAGTLPRVEDVYVDARVIGFALGMAFFTGLLFGVLPALRAASHRAVEHLRSGRGTVGSGQRTRSLLIVAEVGLAVVLIIGAGLMARSFLALRSVDTGFDPARVLAVTLRFNLTGFSEPLPEDGSRVGIVMQRLVQRRDQTLAKLAALPSVIAAGAINGEPIREGLPGGGDLVPEGSPAGTSPVRVDASIVSSGYLRAMGVPLLRGEPLPEQARGGAAIPILVNQTAARLLWPSENSIGRRPRLARGQGPDMIVVGVVGDTRQHGLARNPVPMVYMSQATGPNIVTTFVIRATGNPLALTGMIRDAVREVNPSQPIRSIATLEQTMMESIARDRFFTVLFQIFGGLALVLAAVGVYGVLAYTVGQRTKEIGLRMSLGANALDVLRMVVGGGMRPVLVGLAVGAVASFWLTGLLAEQLFGITATDPVTFFAAPAVLAIVALVACYIPARSALRVDPIAALRDQ